MAAPLASTLFADAAKWVAAAPDYGALLGQFGGAAATDAPTTRRGYADLASCSPMLVCFTYGDDPEHITVAHSPSHYPADPTTASVLDDLLVVLVGDNLNTAVPMVLHGDAL